LRHHAIRCFGEDAVKTAMSVKDAEAQSGSIFAAFARQGQRPVQHSHRSLTNTELRYVSNSVNNILLITTPSASIVKWVTESNRPANIVNDAELQIIFTAGRPHATIPSVSTVTRDVNASFTKCREKIGKLLKVSTKSSLSRRQCHIINHFSGLFWAPSLRDRCLDVTQPSSFRCVDGSPPARR
jgi:hypothetical protein